MEWMHPPRAGNMPVTYDTFRQAAVSLASNRINQLSYFIKHAEQYDSYEYPPLDDDEEIIPCVQIGNCIVEADNHNNVIYQASI